MLQHSNFNNYRQKKKIRKIIPAIIIVVIIAVVIALIVKSYSAKQASVEVTETPSPTVQTAADLTTPTAVPTDAEAAPEVTPTAAPDADLLKSVRKSDGVKTAYLTFDDGPTKSITPQVLDILRRYNVKATFFEVGSLIESNPDMARRVYEEGHLLANHSYAHNYKDLYATPEAFMAEIEKTYALIQQITCDENYFKLFRFPGGSYNAGTWGAKKQEYKTLLRDNGFYYCDWNALNGDAEGGKKTADQLVQGVITSSKDKEDVVILMHDAATKQTTVDALPKVIEYLMSQGYEFRRLDQ